MEILVLNRTAVSLLDPFNYSPKYSSSHKHYYEMSQVQGECEYHQPNEREDVNDQSGLPATQQQRNYIVNVRSFGTLPKYRKVI